MFNSLSTLVFVTSNCFSQIAVTENISSDILQQALENSGVMIQSVEATAASNANNSTNAADGSTENTTEVITLPGTVTQNDLDNKETSTMKIHDPATGTIKKHLIRKVGSSSL